MFSPNTFTNLEPADLADRQAQIKHHLAALENLADPATRIDGWTPFARKLFLQAVAETGLAEAIEKRTADEAERLSYFESLRAGFEKDDKPQSTGTRGRVKSSRRQ